MHTAFYKKGDLQRLYKEGNEFDVYGVEAGWVGEAKQTLLKFTICFCLKQVIR